MQIRDLDAEMRAREWFHSLTLVPGTWTIVRVDGRGFSRLTEGRYGKPFDEAFAALMVTTAEALLTDLGGRYAYTESDEISIVLDPRFDAFGREVEKLVSTTASLAAATFTHAAGEPASFDSRIWTGTGPADVVDYLSWRQSDAARCALNGWCYWTLRAEGRSARQATEALDGASVADKNELLYERGINFNELPTWQRRGIGLSWRTYEKPGHNPITGADVTATRRRIHIDRELPMKGHFRDLIRALLHDPARETPR